MFAFLAVFIDVMALTTSLKLERFWRLIRYVNVFTDCPIGTVRRTIAYSVNMPLRLLLVPNAAVFTQRDRPWSTKRTDRQRELKEVELNVEQ